MIEERGSVSPLIVVIIKMNEKLSQDHRCRAQTQNAGGWGKTKTIYYSSFGTRSEKCTVKLIYV